jgi:hypothetical protein
MEALSNILDSIDARNFAFGGFFLYVFLRWAVQSNKKQKGKSRKPWGKWLSHEKEEWIATFIGCLLFGYMGDYVMDSIGKLLDHFNVLPIELFNDIYINLQELAYLLGGAVFGSVLLMLVQWLLNTSEKKLNNESNS